VVRTENASTLSTSAKLRSLAGVGGHRRLLPGGADIDLGTQRTALMQRREQVRTEPRGAAR